MGHLPSNVVPFLHFFKLSFRQNYVFYFIFCYPTNICPGHLDNIFYTLGRLTERPPISLRGHEPLIFTKRQKPRHRVTSKYPLSAFLVFTVGVIFLTVKTQLRGSQAPLAPLLVRITPDSLLDQSPSHCRLKVCSIL